MSAVHIELVISDSCRTPELAKDKDLIRVTIGLDDDFDVILDLCGGELSNDEFALLHRLWNDDDFPRNFNRVGDSLVITERK